MYPCYRFWKKVGRNDIAYTAEAESYSTSQEKYFAHIPAKIRTKFCSFADNFEKMTMKNKLIQISAWIAAHITLVVVLVTAVTLFLPSSFVWIDTSAITPMLGVVMFGMGLTLRPSDFQPVLQHPKDILIGELAQFLIMPSLAWRLCKLLSLPE